METLATSNIPVQQIEQLEEFAQSVEPELRDVLLSIARCVRDGDDVLVVDGNAPALTPSQAAKHLGMSRAHLYKLLDRGEIQFDRVGRDRRIRFQDLAAFEERRQRDRRELAERFAHQNETRAGAVDEIADLL